MQTADELDESESAGGEEYEAYDPAMLLYDIPFVGVVLALLICLGRGLLARIRSTLHRAQEGKRRTM